MRPVLQRADWNRPRLFALIAAALTAAVFIGANAHLVSVAFSSRPDCVLNPNMEGAATTRAAKPSC